MTSGFQTGHSRAESSLITESRNEQHWHRQMPVSPGSQWNEGIRAGGKSQVQKSKRSKWEYLEHQEGRKMDKQRLEEKNKLEQRFEEMMGQCSYSELQ